VIPEKLIYPILFYEHKIQHKDHPGSNALISICSDKYYWFMMNEDIRRFVQICPTCQTGKGSKQYKLGGLQPLTSHEHNEIVHFDGAGPFFKRLKIGVIVDNYTGNTAFFPCNSESAENMVFGLINHWIPYHGILKKIITDRGTAFTAKANRLVYKFLGIHKLFTSSYHPQTNAKAERRVQELKKALRMLNIDLDDRFTDKQSEKDPRKAQQLVKQIILLLPSIQFSINQKVHSVTQVSPNMLLYGKNLRDMVDFKLARSMSNEIKETKEFDNSKFELIKLLESKIKLAQSHRDANYKKYIIIMKRNYDKHKYEHPFKINDLVAYYIGDRASTNHTIQRRFTGPWKIIGFVNKVTATIYNEATKEKFSCHICMLKHYYQHDFIPISQFSNHERKKHLPSHRPRRGEKIIKTKKHKHKHHHK
jgi:transposase InsO family protein